MTDAAPAMHRNPVDSSSVRSVGYDPIERVLEVEYRPHRVYRYFDVPDDVYEGLVHASSIGRYVNYKIKERFRYEEV
jgi:hypothetical protein